MFSLREDTVLDPFLGTATTTVAAMATGRNSIGIEIDKPKLGARAKYERHRVYGHPARQARGLQKGIHVKAVKVELIRDYTKRGYSANKIQRELKAQGKGMRRKEVLKYVRQFKGKQLKKDSSKYARKKYRK